MARQAQPIVGEWYQTASGESFEVVALDLEDETVDIQYFDGALEELDMENWLELDLEVIEAPEDWSGSMDLMSEDYGVDLDRPPGGSDNHNPLDQLDGL